MIKNILIVASLASLLTSCESKAGTGALAGGAIGAVAGALTGGGTGALIGGAVGAAGGAAVGATIKTKEPKKVAEAVVEPVQQLEIVQALSLQEIKTLSKNDIRDDLIISKIQKTNSRYELTPDEIIDLKKSGVSQKVIQYMIETK